MFSEIAINLLIGVWGTATVFCCIGALVTWTAEKGYMKKLSKAVIDAINSTEIQKPVVLKDLLSDLERPQSIGDRIRDFIRYKQPWVGGYGAPGSPAYGYGAARPEYTQPVLGSMVNDAVINGYKIDATHVFAPANIGGMNVQAGEIITLRNIDGTEHRITAVATGSMPNLYAPPQINYIPSSMDRMINPIGLGNTVPGMISGSGYRRIT